MPRCHSCASPRRSRSKAMGGGSRYAKTKTDNRVRVLPLHSLAARALRAWKAMGWAKWVGHHPAPTDVLFPNERGQAWRPQLAGMLRADLRAAGLPDTYEGRPYTAHATRRSFATWLTEAGVAEGTIKRLMGHASAAVTAQHYAALALSTLQRAVECVHLDLSTGEVIALPMRAVAVANATQKAAGLGADFGVLVRPAPSTRGIPQ
jgi:hypothetical protein